MLIGISVVVSMIMLLCFSISRFELNGFTEFMAG